MTSGKVRNRVVGGCCQGLPDQPFRPGKVARCRVGHFIEHAADERDCQPALRLDGSRIKCRRSLEQADDFRIIATRTRLRQSRPSSENEVERVGIISRSGSLCADQLEVERERYPARDFVL